MLPTRNNNNWSLQLGQKTSFQFYKGCNPVEIWFVDANDITETKTSLDWLVEDMHNHAIIGVDLEWMAELPWEPRTEKHIPISLVQMATDNRCVLLTTRGVSTPVSTPIIQSE